MRWLVQSAAAAALLLLCSGMPAGAVVRDANASSAPIHFNDGAIATTFDHCGDADVCATVAYPDGTLLSMVSEGAAYCQPYLIHFVRTNARAATVYEFTRTLNHDAAHSGAFGSGCGNNQATQLTLDRGLIHLTIDEYKDGTLRFVFAAISDGKRQAGS